MTIAKNIPILIVTIDGNYSLRLCFGVINIKATGNERREIGREKKKELKLYFSTHTDTDAFGRQHRAASSTEQQLRCTQNPRKSTNNNKCAKW